MSPMLPPIWQRLHQHGFLALPLLLLLPLLVFAALGRRRGASIAGSRRLPPSPPKLPIIGNLHQLGSGNHRSLAALSRRIGPLMLLQLGQVRTLVVSSANAVEEMMKTHGAAFANRPQMEAAKRLLYPSEVGILPYGEKWKSQRRICTLHLLGNRMGQSCRVAREEEVAFMMEKIQRLSSSSGAVDLREILQDFITDLISRLIHGRCFRDVGLNKVFRALLEEYFPLFTQFHVGDYFPSLQWLSVFTALDSKVQRTVQKWEHLLDGIIDNHLNRSAGNSELYQEGFVDALLALQSDPSAQYPITMQDVRALTKDMLVAGADTPYMTVEWAMAEFIRSSEAMRRAQTEVRRIAGAKRIVEEADTAQMSYLTAVIKETLRLHPPAPLLLPRQSSEDTQIGGYDIPRRTTVLINAWVIMRDPDFWEAPDEFRPERFLGASVDFRGSDFQFIPFGAGRRICPGMQFAVSAVELALANLLQRFDWELPEGMRGEDLDMDEKFGILTSRKHRLHLVPIPRLHATTCSA